MTYPAGDINGGGLQDYTYEGTWVDGKWDTDVLIDSEGGGGGGGVRHNYRKGAIS